MGDGESVDALLQPLLQPGSQTLQLVGPARKVEDVEDVAERQVQAAGVGDAKT